MRRKAYTSISNPSLTSFFLFGAAVDFRMRINAAFFLRLVFLNNFRV